MKTTLPTGHSIHCCGWGATCHPAIQLQSCSYSSLRQEMVIVSSSPILDHSQGIWHYICSKRQSFLPTLQPFPTPPTPAETIILRDWGVPGKKEPLALWESRSLAMAVQLPVMQSNGLEILYLLRYLTQCGLGMGVTGLKLYSSMSSHPQWMR